MPPRWLCGIIVAFWLATTGWLFWHDLRPILLAGEPPLFHPDFVDEVHRSENPLITNWIVERQDKDQTAARPVFLASTSVNYDEKKDAYTLRAKLDTALGPKLQPFTVAKFFKINGIASSYCVNRSGQLLSLEARVNARFDVESFPFHRLFNIQSNPFPKNSSSEQISLTIRGEVRDGQFLSHCNATAESQNEPIQLLHIDLPPAAVTYKGSVLMPLHPLNHIHGLHLGQSWRQPLVDPLQDAFAFLPGISGGVRWLNARVLPRPETLKVDDNEMRCLVIEYTNDENEIVGRTWVEQDGERVLQQEAILENSRWIMKRELSRQNGLRLLDLGHD